MTTLTVPVLLVMLLGVIGRRGYGLALALGGVTAAGAAFSAGSLALPTFYAVAFGVVLIMLLRAATPGRALQAPPPGVPLLLGMLAWGCFVTIAAPLLFDGLQTVTANRTVLTAGVLTSSNIAQMLYLAIGVCVVAFLARDPGTAPDLVGIAAGGGVLLSFWRWVSTVTGLPFPLGVFDNSPTLIYIETFAGGASRFRGIFSEPAALAGSCLVMIAYGLSRAAHTDGWRRAGALALAGVAILLGVVSTATTFLVAGVALAALFAVAALIGFLGRTTRLSASLAAVACLLVIAGTFVLPIAGHFVQAAVAAKSGMSSYTDRSGVDNQSYATFVDTWGFGVGLGAGRASSIVPTVLSTLGLPGTLLLVAAIAALVGRARLVPEYRPVIWALVALLVTKAVSGPDLSDTTGLIWLCLGVLAKCAVDLRRSASDDDLRPRLALPAPRTRGVRRAIGAVR